MIAVLVVSILFLVLAIILAVISILHVLLDNKVKKLNILYLIFCFSISLIISIQLFNHYIEQVENRAIQRYINGDYELVDIIVDGEIVGSYYQLNKHEM